MYHVYIIRSKVKSDTTYIGYSKNAEKRLEAHNVGHSNFTSKYKPWELIAKFSFKDINVAKNFEKYLKTSSGKAFSRKHFL